MKTFKAFLLVFVAILLAACSSGPSDREVQAIVQSQMNQVNTLSDRFGFPMAEVFDSKTTVLNRIEQEGGRWLVEFEVSLIAKKSIAEAFPDPMLRGAMMLAFGNFQKGQVISMGRSTMILLEGDRGWTVL